MADATVANVLEDARAFLNDVNANQFTDGVLLPYVKIAWDELAIHLAAHSIPVLMEVSSEVDIDSNTVDIAAPADLVTPIKLQEKPQGSSDQYYVDMTNRFWEPSEYAATAYINFWAWREQRIHFAPHTSTQTVRIFYIKDLSVIADSNSILAVNHCKAVMSKRVAALAARYAGANPTRADALDNEAEYFLKLLMTREVMGKQDITVRRRPYMSRYRRMR